MAYIYLIRMLPQFLSRNSVNVHPEISKPFLGQLIPGFVVVCFELKIFFLVLVDLGMPEFPLFRFKHVREQNIFDSSNE